MTIITQSTSILCSDNPGVRMCEGPLYLKVGRVENSTVIAIINGDCSFETAGHYPMVVIHNIDL